MRLIKTLGLAAIAALASMAFLGASTASATTSTVLCSTHTSLVCTEGAVENAEVKMELASGVGKLLSSLATVLCLNVSATANALGLGEEEAQVIHGSTFEPTNCGTNSGHTNCTITEVEPSLFSLSKTGLDEGTLTASGGETHVFCEKVGIFQVTVDCYYLANGLEFSVGGGHLTASETPVNIKEGSFFCPAESKLDGLLKATPEELYVLE